MVKTPVQYNKKQRRLVMQENVAAYAFLLPFLIFFVGFVLYPMFMCVYTSFFDSTMNREDIFVGLKNWEWNGMEWNEMERNGMKWNGIESKE